jgi:hypothetical protein
MGSAGNGSGNVRSAHIAVSPVAVSANYASVIIPIAAFRAREGLPRLRGSLSLSTKCQVNFAYNRDPPAHDSG